jgi:hypothetical protein
MAKVIEMGNYCNRWPLCGCGYGWRQWQLIAEDEEWTASQLVLDSAEIEIRNFLSCVSERCPDPDFRKAAAIQLTKPIFGGQ